MPSPSSPTRASADPRRWDRSGLVDIGAQAEVRIRWSDESGSPTGESSMLGFTTLHRLSVGTTPWLPGTAFGTAEVSTEEELYWWSPPAVFETPVQNLVVPIHSALGRYSVGLGSAGIGGSRDL